MKKCQICGKPATVHFTQIINNEMKNIDLCDECAEKNGLFESKGSPLAMLAELGESLFGEVKHNISALSGLICSSCGCTPMMFKETGRLGCSNCYKDLKLIVDKLIENSQKGKCHVGKKIRNQENSFVNTDMPEVIDLSKSKKSKKEDSQKLLKDLKCKLEQAISDERYEDAAKLRDEIKNLSK